MALQTTSDDDRRLVEVDAALRPVNLATAIVVAVAAWSFVPRFGVAFGVLASLLLAYWGVRGLIGDMLDVRGWNKVLLALMVVSIGGASILSGGSDSPVVFFFGTLAVFANAVFPRRYVMSMLTTVAIGALAAIDLTLGRSINNLAFVSAIIVSAYLPIFTDSMVGIELTQRRRAVMDNLTGCLNRHALGTRILELEAHGARFDSTLAVIVFDLDHFKRVNDQFGHECGDRVLEHVAYIARKQLRGHELLYRLGGEEFALILPGADPAAATVCAERIRLAIAAEPLGDIDVTASFGVAYEHAPFSVHEMLDAADRRMYVAKQLGRNRVVASDTLTAA